MSSDGLSRQEILGHLLLIVEKMEKVSEMLNRDAAQEQKKDGEEWTETREQAGRHIKEIHDLYSFVRRLPSDETGIATLSILSILIQIQSSFRHILVLLDMLRGQSFDEVFMDSFRRIASKVHQAFLVLKRMMNNCGSDGETAEECLQEVLKLEREVDEDNIIICRQISVSGDANTVCYLMRKIVRELEHVSDYIKECAEILVDF